MHMVKRYYYQSKETDPLFKSQHGSGWQVFDRDAAGLGTVCFCINKYYAEKICEALNASDHGSQQYPSTTPGIARRSLIEASGDMREGIITAADFEAVRKRCGPVAFPPERK